MHKLSVVKIGGNVINDSNALDAFLAKFSHMPEPKILVHGGGKKATELAQKMGLQPTMVDGRRITDGAMLDVVVMSYAGLVNKTIVSKLQSLNTNALGLSGADGNYLTAKKRPIKDIDYGFVGDCTGDSVNSQFLNLLLTQGITPICCAITHNGKGQLLNTNADTIAATIAQAMSRDYEVMLTYCFELPGLLKNIDNPDSKIDAIPTSEIDGLKKDGTIHSGMHPKIDNCVDAINGGVTNVFICDWNAVEKPELGTSIEK